MKYKYYKINQKVKTKRYWGNLARFGLLGTVTGLAIIALNGLPADNSEPLEAESEIHIGSTLAHNQTKEEKEESEDKVKNEIKLTSANKETNELLMHKVTATLYWIGEGATAENDYISNVESAWDSDAVKRFGGVDSPAKRSFAPRHNPYYFALPAAEFDEHGIISGAREASPWAGQAAALSEGQSLFKGRWVKVAANGHTVYAQWQDVGPNEERDYDYVFGEKGPSNTFGEHAGIDLSPNAAKALQINGSGDVSWQFVDAKDVPSGPWKQYPAIDNQTHWE